MDLLGQVDFPYSPVTERLRWLAPANGFKRAAVIPLALTDAWGCGLAVRHMPCCTGLEPEQSKKKEEASPCEELVGTERVTGMTTLTSI